MQKLQFKVLYRQFLFRMVDLELLSASAQGDISTLLGRFAALLIIFSLWMSAGVVAAGATALPPELHLIAAWAMEHFLIATTMLVVGLFAVISWDSMFPDRRDVMVLAPLPIRARTLFLAKVAAVAVALGSTVIALNVFTGLGSIALAAAPKVSTPADDPAMPPVKAGDMQAVLNRDLTPALTGNGALADPGAGVTIGILQHGERRIFAYGAAKPDSIFEIGSITKTFTALLLARMVQEGRTRLDESVRELLPPETAVKPSGREIALLDLATQHSGLPRMPDNITPPSFNNPYPDYPAESLYQYVGRHGLAKPADTTFLYSNLGFALLGQALADRAGIAYPDLLQREITGPLRLNDTAVSVSGDRRGRIIPGFDSSHQFAARWSEGPVAGAGGIRSTAGDLLTFLDAQLHPEAFPALASAIRQTHELHAEGFPGTRIALAWYFIDEANGYWHGGDTPGYSSFAFFQPEGDVAVVVLVNHGPGVFADVAEQLGRHIGSRMRGQPAISLANRILPSGGGLAAGLRMVAVYWFTMLATGVFTFGLVLSIQGVAQLLPRQQFLRVSAFLQIAAFVLFVSMYFMQLPFASPVDLTSPENQTLLPWLPSYWFLGMFQQLNGSRHAQLTIFAKRAWIGLAASIAGAAAAYLICYFRTLRKIAEQPDILPSRAGLHWLPRFGGALPTAIVQFSIRTLTRSRRHRVTLCFYMGIAFAIVLFSMKAPTLQENITPGDPWHKVNGQMLAASVLLLGSAIIGMRVAFAMPLDLRANWVFQVLPMRGGPQSLAAARRSLYALGAAPVWLGCAAVFLWMWPWRPATGHLALLGMLGMALAEICLMNFRKIPFTCSYLPGKTHFHLAAFAYAAVALLLSEGAKFERHTLTDDPRGFVITLAVLAALVAALRWRNSDLANSPQGKLEFEDTPPPVIQRLGLNRDGTSAA